MEELSDFTIEKNDGACDTYTPEERKQITNTIPQVFCPKCNTVSVWQPDNTYCCPNCKTVFNSEKFFLD